MARHRPPRGRAGVGNTRCSTAVWRARGGWSGARTSGRQIFGGHHPVANRPPRRLPVSPGESGASIRVRGSRRAPMCVSPREADGKSGLLHCSGSRRMSQECGRRDRLWTRSLAIWGSRSGVVASMGLSTVLRGVFDRFSITFLDHFFKNFTTEHFGCR